LKERAFKTGVVEIRTNNSVIFDFQGEREHHPIAKALILIRRGSRRRGRGRMRKRVSAREKLLNANQLLDG
jgi:hypothetical protein